MITEAVEAPQAFLALYNTDIGDRNHMLTIVAWYHVPGGWSV